MRHPEACLQIGYQHIKTTEQKSLHLRESEI